MTNVRTEVSDGLKTGWYINGNCRRRRRACSHEKFEDVPSVVQSICYTLRASATTSTTCSIHATQGNLQECTAQLQVSRPESWRTMPLAGTGPGIIAALRAHRRAALHFRSCKSGYMDDDRQRRRSLLESESNLFWT